MLSVRGVGIDFKVGFGGHGFYLPLPLLTKEGDLGNHINFAGFRPGTTRSFCFGKRTQNHFRPCASLRGSAPPYRITWLRNSLRSDSARRKVGFGTAARPHPRRVGGNKSKKDQRDFAGVLNPKQGSGIWRSRRLFLKPQLFSDQVTEAFLGFRVTWDRSLFAGSWISINVVFLSVSFQIASCGNQLPNEIPSLHATSTVMSFLFIPGCSSEGSASIIKL